MVGFLLLGVFNALIGAVYVVGKKRVLGVMVLPRISGDAIKALGGYCRCTFSLKGKKRRMQLFHVLVLRRLLLLLLRLLLLPLLLRTESILQAHKGLCVFSNQ